MDLSNVLSRPIRVCELPQVYNKERQSPPLCSMRLRKRCAYTEQKILDMEMCPTLKFLMDEVNITLEPF